MFNLDDARKRGLSDEQISKSLSDFYKFDVDKASKAGYSLPEIVDYINTEIDPAPVRSTKASEARRFIKEVGGGTLKDLGGVIAKAGGGILKGMSLGAVDPEKGTSGLPFSKKGEQLPYAPPLGKSLEELGVSPEIAHNPYIQIGPAFAGFMAPFTLASKGVGAVGTGVTKVLPVLAKGGKAGALLRGAAQSGAALGVTGAVEVREDDETMLGNALSYAAFGVGLHLTFAAAKPIAKHIKNMVKYKKITKDFTADDLQRALTGREGASQEAKSFINLLSTAERKHIAKAVIKGKGIKGRLTVPRFGKKAKVPDVTPKPVGELKGLPAITESSVASRIAAGDKGAIPDLHRLVKRTLGGRGSLESQAFYTRVLGKATEGKTTKAFSSIEKQVNHALGRDIQNVIKSADTYADQIAKTHNKSLKPLVAPVKEGELKKQDAFDEKSLQQEFTNTVAKAIAEGRDPAKELAELTKKVGRLRPLEPKGIRPSGGEEYIVTGGSSVSKLGKNLSKAKKGYAVVVDEKTNRVLNKTEITKEDITRYIHEFADELAASKNVFVGTWVEGGKSYIGLSKRIASKSEALAEARKNGERFIWDFKKGKELEVLYPKEAGVLTEPITKDPIIREVTKATEKLFLEKGLKRDPNKNLAVDIADHLVAGDVELTEGLNKILSENNISVVDFGRKMFEISASQAGRTLQPLSVLSRKLNSLAAASPEGKAALEEVKAASYLVSDTDRLPAWRRVTNIWRRLLISMLATASRNVVVQAGVVSVDSLTSLMDSGIQAAMKGMGIKVASKYAVHPADAFSSFLNLFKKNKGSVDAILKHFPKEEHKLFSHYMSDVSYAMRKGTLKPNGVVDNILLKAEVGADALNVFNRFQEWLVRRSIFLGKLDTFTKNRRGKDLATIIKENDFASLKEEDIADAVQEALRMTFGLRPVKGTATYDFVSLINKIPGAAMPMPFPNFLIQALKYNFQHSGAGILRFLSAAERKAFGQGKTDVISRSVIGATMFLAAYKVRTSKLGGERWYEIQLDSGKTVDIRPYNPFAMHLYAAELTKRYQEDTLHNLSKKDFIEGFLSVGLRAGSGLYMLDNILKSFTIGGSGRTAWRHFQTVIGEFAGGFFMPLQQLADIAAEFDEESQVVRTTREHPLTGPTLKRIPFGGRALPPLSVPLKAGELKREAPLLRQLTGIMLKSPKNVVEKEMDRLGLNVWQVIQASKEPKTDRLIAKEMGPIVEKRVAPYLKTDFYKTRPEPQKELIILKLLQGARQMAMLRFARKYPDLYRDLLREGIPQREKRIYEDILKKPLTEVF